MTYGDGVKVVTNNHARPVVDAWELSAAERAEFDYIDWPAIDAGSDSASFFRYRGELYDLGEFSAFRIGPGSNWFGDSLGDSWHGYLTESFFSAVLVRYSDDFESVTVGLALS